RAARHRAREQARALRARDERRRRRDVWRGDEGPGRSRLRGRLEALREPHGAAEASARAMSVSAGEWRAFRERGGVVDLASRVKLLFTGGDRTRYLNGQLTANIAAAKCPSVVPACVTTAKGRLCADVFVSIG